MSEGKFTLQLPYNGYLPKVKYLMLTTQLTLDEGLALREIVNLIERWLCAMLSPRNTST